MAHVHVNFDATFPFYQNVKSLSKLFSLNEGETPTIISNFINVTFINVSFYGIFK